MQRIPTGLVKEISVTIGEAHTAEAMGNPGVAVLGTTALILMFEDVSARLMKPFLETGEASVGTTVNVSHVNTAAVGEVVTVRAFVSKAEGRRVLFQCQAECGGKVLMHGTHERATVSLEHFLQRRDAP